MKEEKECDSLKGSVGAPGLRPGEVTVPEQIQISKVEMSIRQDRDGYGGAGLTGEYVLSISVSSDTREFLERLQRQVACSISTNCTRVGMFWPDFEIKKI